MYFQLSKSAFFGCNSKQNVQSPKLVANVMKGFKTGQYKNSDSFHASRILAIFLAQVNKIEKCDFNMICLTLLGVCPNKALKRSALNDKTCHK